MNCELACLGFVSRYVHKVPEYILKNKGNIVSRICLIKKRIIALRANGYLISLEKEPIEKWHALTNPFKCIYRTSFEQS